MTDPLDVLRQLPRLGRHLEAELSDHDVERLVRGAAELRQRRRSRRSLARGLALGAASSIVLVLVLRMSNAGKLLPQASGPGQPTVLAPLVTSGTRTPVPPRAPEVLTLRDESRAIALEQATNLSIETDAPERVRLRLERGRARFEVTHRPSRAFSVRAGSVTVSVIGTTFGVEVVADRVGVSVEKGMVEVDWGVGQRRLVAGEGGWFPPLVTSGNTEAEVARTPDRTTGKPHSAARAGDSERATDESAQALLAEVDVARSQGKPDRAVQLLRRILHEHPRDPRAPLAAFTLGRVLLNELGRPREAAAAFHQVRERAPASQFAEDALAREVEAWSAAGEPARARALAALYLERYPSGRHALRIKALAGLE
jgi:transmembrane sensor